MSAYGGSGSGAPVGNTPTRAPSQTRAPARSARPRRVLQRAHGRSERKSPPANADEEVDEPERERDDPEDEDEANAPAARGPVGEEDAVGSAIRATRARVERVEEGLGRAPELGEPLSTDRGIRVSGGARPGPVVMVTAEMWWPRNLPCSPAANGIPRSRSCVATPASSGSVPVSSATRAAAVRTSVREGETGPSPAIAIRGCPRPPRPSSTTTATADFAKGEVSAKRSAPAPPYAPPSVETSTSVCSGTGPTPVSRRCEAAGELEQRGGAGRVVAERPLRAGVVPMSNDDDGVVGAPGYDRRRRSSAARARGRRGSPSTCPPPRSDRAS